MFCCILLYYYVIMSNRNQNFAFILKLKHLTRPQRTQRMLIYE